MRRKWKKLLLPAMCAFMLQIPVIVNAEAVDSSNNVTSAVETPVDRKRIQMRVWFIWMTWHMIPQQDIFIS